MPATALLFRAKAITERYYRDGSGWGKVLAALRIGSSWFIPPVEHRHQRDVDGDSRRYCGRQDMAKNYPWWLAFLLTEKRTRMV